MKVLFCMEQMYETDFFNMPGVRDMLRNIEAGRNSWEYWSIRENKLTNLSEIEGENGGNVDYPRLGETQTENLVIVTDSMELSRILGKQGICCVGYQSEDDSRFFPGADMVLNSFESVDHIFFDRIWRHFCGIPVVIAETKRTLIRESVMEDFEELYFISREDESDVYMNSMPEEYEAEKEKFLAYVKEEYRYYDFGLWTVIEKESGRVMGRCGFSPVQDASSDQYRIELGYLIGKTCRKKGYAYEVCLKILEYGFNWLQFSCVYASIRSDNIPSKNLAAKLGFYRWRADGKEDETKMEIWKKDRDTEEKVCLGEIVKPVQ